MLLLVFQDQQYIVLLLLTKTSKNHISSPSSPTESLDDLTSMVVKLFGEVENKNVPIPEFPEHPFQEEHLKVSVLVKLPSVLTLCATAVKLCLTRGPVFTSPS